MNDLVSEFGYQLAIILFQITQTGVNWHSLPTSILDEHLFVCKLALSLCGKQCFKLLRYIYEHGTNYLLLPCGKEYCILFMA